MISRERVLELIYPLVVNFGDPGQDRLDMDCDTLAHYQEDVLKMAVEYLIKERKQTGYPLFGEIYDGIERAYEQIALIGGGEDRSCARCNDSGMIFVPETNTVRFCGCQLGRKKRAGFEAYWKNKHDIKKAVLAARKVWEETE